MDFVSIRIITSDVARLVEFYERATGARKAVLDIAIRDGVGAGGIQDLFLSSDASSYSFNYIRTLQNLYIIKNVR